jgi:hypothetical protein
LNRISRKDRYPLPLIYDTLRNIGKAKWFTKLDVIAAFHKIRMREGDEWKTAFRTRYGLFEWMVTPFGLANAPSTFQKYINWALRDFLDEFCSAYVDDVLIYTDGTLEEHREHVRKVLGKLDSAGLQLDIEKCEFEVTRTKYLGFIIIAGEGISMDPAKIEAIVSWESPSSVKGVQSFIGFANFYRKFIRGFSEIAKPITDLVRKDVPFKWTREAELAFVAMKKLFTTGPLLVQFDPDRETIVETDASGWAVGGGLFQIGDDGLKRPCAFFSKKMNSAECNYEIYDKEMLAIIRCLREWDTDLRSVRSFEICTDHKNLEYFMTAKRLTERQVRWSLDLSKYNFTLSYIKGAANIVADAMSRRTQDIPQNDSDARVADRTYQLLPNSSLVNLTGRGKEVSVKTFRVRIQTSRVTTRGEAAAEAAEAVEALEAAETPAEEATTLTMEEAAVEGTAAEEVAALAPLNSTLPTVGEREPLAELWVSALAQDDSYGEILRALRANARKFPQELKLQVSIGECSLQGDDVYWRGRKWVPDSEALRTGITQHMHDSIMSGHPGREVLCAIMGRSYFWPGMLADVRRFVRNCDLCHSSKAWRERKQGYLKPLPVPERIWSQISVDFVVELPESDGYTNIMVIVDRLGKGAIFEPMAKITAIDVCEAFIRRFYSQHGVPDAIVSDRGSQFVSQLWKLVCKMLGTKRKLSTAWHPQTDGSTERMNSTLESFLRTYCNYLQDDWKPLLPMGELAINNRDAASTGVSPFFLTHGYNFEMLQLEDPLLQYADDTNSPVQKAHNIVRKLHEATEWAQTSMAVAQQVQEEQANRKRQAAISYKVGDKVWLDLRNIRTDRKSKKLDAKHAKFTVTKVIGSHSFELNIKNVHPVFHSDLLRPASDDPFPSQRTNDSQPIPTVLGATAEEDEYDIEEIQSHRTKKIGRRKVNQLLVKWRGYARASWELDWQVDECAALDAYEAKLGYSLAGDASWNQPARRGRKGGKKVHWARLP